MALNFPSSPSINDTYTYGDKTWVWNGRFWQIQAAGAINDIAIGNITPNTGAFTTLTATGNITAQGNVQGQYILGNGAFLTGISGSSTYGNANVANYLPNYGGNISTNVVSGNFYANSILPWSPTAGLINDAVDIGNSTLSFRDIYVGNVITPAGNQGNSTQIQPASGVGESGVAFVDAITGSAADVSAGTLYVESIDAIGNVTVDTFVEANEIIALSNVSGTGGNFSGNVSASYFLGNGAFLTGIAAGYSNANVANYLPNYQGLISNVDFRSTSPAAVAMVVTDRPITIGGNTYSYITIPNDGNANSVATELTNHGLGNVLISSGPDDHEWIFDNTGNLTAPGNIQAGNAVSANYFLGNGALLTGITTNYSNANVANYLATYNGNALFSNVTVSQDAVILGNLRVEGNTTYINVNDLVVDDYLVIIGNAATQVSDLNGAGLQIGNLANSNIQFVYDYTSNVMTLNRGANIANVLNVSGNVTGNYFIGNGSLLTGIVTSSYSNANVANYLPTYTGNVTAGNISVTGNVTANWFVGNINTTNSLVTSGNVTANNFIGSDPNVNLIAGSYTWAFNDAGNLVLPSNTFAVNYANGVQVSLGGSYSNADVANYLASNANVTITVGVSNITTQGNISGNYFIGNGALLTGVVTSSYSNANVANYLPTYTGNITAGNIAVTGNVTANWFVGNINTTNSLVTSGNITANNFIGSDPNVGLVAGNYTWLFDNAGNVTLPSNTFAVNYANGTAVSLGGTYSNADVANYLPTYNGNALFSNITVSRDAVILGNLRVEGNTTYINVSDLIVEDKDIIVAANANATMTDLNGAGLQIGNRSAGGNITFFYNSTSNVMTLSHGANIANVLNVAGNITATGNVNTGNLVGSGTNVEIVGGSYTWTFNGSGNLVLPGNTFAVNYANGTQVALAGSYSNTNVKAYLGNFDGNIIPSANVTYDLGSNSNRWNDLYLNNSTIYIGAQEITANADSTIFSGNISVGNLVGTGDNVDIKAGAYTWRFDNAGNLTLPANTSAINYANGATVPVGYGNASVAAYLGSNANLTILSQGNITGNYFIGNGALLTGVVTSSYSNANVANYLPTYTGNIAAGNVTATGNVQGAYILGNGALLTGLPATYGNSNVAAYLASNANVTLAIGTGNITTQGNLAVGNLIGSGDNVDLKAGSYTWRFDSTGNLTLPANSTAIYYANGTQVPVGYGNANVAAYLAAYNGNALFSNITVSQDAVVLGNLRVEGNTTYINVSDLIVEDKDIIVAANASATMTDLNGAGLQIGNRTAGGNITFFYNSISNVMSLSHGANVANVLNVSGNVTANNFIGSEANTSIVAGAYTWTFNSAGNLVLPSNTFAVNYANGTAASLGGSYGNADVANYLASNSNVNILTTGNVTGNYILGNGALLTGLPATYSNANVANYLPTYTGNLSAGNYTGSGINVSIVAGTYTWSFNDLGNFVLPGNSFSVNYANGTQVALGGTYSNSNVAAYLASNSNVNILTTGNVTGNYILGNGALLTGLPATYSNANVANYLPTYTGNLSAGNYTGSGINVSVVAGVYTWSFNDLGNLVLPANSFSINYANGTQVALSGTYSNSNVAAYLASNANVTVSVGTGNITTQGNITGNYFIGNGALLTGVVTSSYSNANVANYLPTYTGNIAAGNISVTGNVNSGNVTANNFIGSEANTSIVANIYTWTFNSAGNLVLPGNTFSVNYANGAQVALGSGSGSYSNANVANYLPTYTGNITAGNVIATGNVIGNWFVGNVNTTNSLVTSGNVTANNFVGSGNNVTLASDSYTWTFDNTGNFILPGNTTAIYYANGTQVPVGYGNANVAAYLQAYNANALFSNVTVSRDVLILGNLRVEGNTTEINVSNIFLEDKDIIVAANANATLSDLNGAGLQIGNRTAGGNITFFYNSISNVMSLSHGANIANVLNVAGNIVATGNVTGNYILGNGAFLTGLPATYGNSNVAAYLASNANVTVSVGTGNITTQGNLTAGNFIGSGSNVRLESANYAWQFDNAGNLTLPGNTFSVNYANGAQVSLGGSYGNADVANYLASNANLTISVGTGNITTQGNLAVGNLIGSGNNVEITAGAYTWTLDNTGNLTLPGNTTAINYANGTPVPVGYGNANVATYLASNANVTVSVGVSNITTQGNVSGNYFIGNGALLTGVVTSSYSNANVANYLPTYTGNVSAGNLNLTGNIVDTGAIFVITGANGNVILAPNGTSRIIATTSGANVIGNLDVAGNVNANGATLTGNLSVGNLIGSGDNVEITAGAYTWTLDNTGNLILPGNTTAIYYANGTQVPVGYGNANVATYLASNAAVTILTTANITTAANISGAYILGNGAFLSGLPATYGNSNVAAYLAAYNGNALFSNITVSQDAVILGNLRVEGNTTYINVTDLIVEDKDIIVAANANATLTDLNGAGLQIGNRSAGGNITFFYNSTSNVMSLSHGANIANVLNVSGNVTATGNISATYLLGNGALLTGIASAYGNSNVANYLASNANIDITIGTGNITTQGNISVGSIQGSNANTTIVANVYSWTFDDTGNLTLPGNTTAINYANGTQVPIGYNNASVANYMGSNANVTLSIGTGNITTQGNIKSRTLYLGSHEDVSYQAYGNITLSGGSADNNSNVSIVANGAMTTSYVLKLPADTPNAGDVLTVKNFGSQLLFGNVANLIWSAPAGSYTNANVANYLVTYNANALFSNITVSRDAVILGNLRVEGNTTYINVSDLIVEDKDIIVAANANATMTDLNGAGLQIGNRSAGGNITFFYDSTSNVMSLSHGANIANILNVAGNVTATGNVNTGNLVGSGTNVEIVSGAYTWTFDGAGNLTGTGNVSAGNFVGTAGNTSIVTANYTWTFNNAGNLVLPGNTFGVTYANGTTVSLGGSYSNADVANYLPTYTGNITAGNVIATGNVIGNWFVGNINTTNSLVTSGNITANNFIGSAANTRIVANIYTWTFDSAGNLSLPSNSFSVNYANGTAVNLGGSYSNADVANYLPTYTGNITAGNITTTGNITTNNFIGSSGNTSIVTAGYTWVFDNAGNLVLPGNSFSVNYANGAQVALGSGSGSYSNANVQAYLGNFDGNIIPSANVTYNLGSNSNRWNDLYLNNSTIYIGAQEITANADSTVFSGNISANYITANISTTGNITAGNFVGSAANTRIVASVYTWTFNSAGNLVLPGNTFSVNYANGTQVTLGGSSSYSNADVANYLPTFTGNVGAGNLNITGNIIDTGALNIITGASGNITLAPGNSNVLIARTTGANITGTLGVTGNVDAGNLNITGNIVDTGALTIITGASGNITLSPGNTSVLIARTTGANVTGTLGVTGNITGGNISTTIVSATGNVSGGNITTTGVVTATGNITGGNIVTTGIVSATGNVNAGNLNVTGNIVDTSALTIITGASGNISLAPNNTSVLVATTTGVNVSGTFNSTGSFITAGNVTANNLIGTGVNTSIVSNNYTWTFNSEGNFVLPGNTFGVTYANGTAVSLGGSYGNADVGSYLQTYNGNALFSNITVSRDAVVLGNLRVEGNTTYINVSDLVIEDKDIIVAANASATMTDLNGAGLQIGNRTAGGNITFFYDSTSNVMSLSHGANIANVLNVAGNITANSLVGVGTNVELVGGSYTWTFNGSGNLVLPGNTFSVNYANGAQVSLGGSYSNAEVASYLASNSNVTILTGVANITTQGNVAAGYLLGNATFADGVSNTYFGNVSPSSPAQGDIWINSDTAVQLIYFVDANGGQWAEMAADTSISVTGNYTDSNVTTLLASLGANTISSSANITTSANISAGYILGNGSQLTGLDFTNYTNSNVANYLVSYNANALFSNVTVSRDMVIIGNLRVEGNTTEINVSNIFLEDKDIIVAANANATLSDLNGAGLQIGNITAGGNITFFYDSTSNVMSLSHGANISNVLNVTGNISAANITATGNITGNTNGFTIGYRDVPQVSWSNATMALADASKHYYTSTGGVTLTVPSNANVDFPIGATIAFYNRSSANCTIAPQASVNIFLVGNSTITPTANRTITSNGGGTLTKVDTNTWMLSAANVV